MTKYYVDNLGNYIGAFEGNTGKVPVGAIEISEPPKDARATWNGVNFVEPEASVEDQVKKEIISQGYSVETVVGAIVNKWGFNDSTQWDDLIQKISDARQKLPK